MDREYVNLIARLSQVARRSPVYSPAIEAKIMLDIGKALMLVWEHEPADQFATIMEERIGFKLSHARRMMCAAARFLSPQLAPHKEAFCKLGKTKLFYLMAESDATLLRLATGGDIAFETLSDMQRMTSREFNALLVAVRRAPGAICRTLRTSRVRAHAAIQEAMLITRFRCCDDDARELIMAVAEEHRAEGMKVSRSPLSA